MVDERKYLKVKVKSLAEEAKIIRQEEKRTTRPSIKFGLRDHRIGIVRNEMRHTLIAYGFIRGKAYKEVENRTHEAPDWDKVRSMVKRYGSHWDQRVYRDGKYTAPEEYLSTHRDRVMMQFEKWLDKARDHLSFIEK